ncbi:MAG: hypothetical protein JO138_12045 [Acidobacteriaceae bacterium]|nr:hypothetical protein [Acidobacteriaceae bacterium]
MSSNTVWQLAGAVCMVASCLPAFARQAADSNSGTPTSIVVTVEPKRGKEVPALESQDVVVKEGNEKRPVTGLAPLHGPIELAILIDDSARSSFDTEIGTLKQFITSLPSDFRVAVGYMRNGYTQFTQNFTADHAAAANAIRVPAGPGGADVDPYGSLADAIKKWPQSDAERKQVIMISSGIEGLGGGYYPDNPYLTSGIEAAVKAKVVVYTIYSPSVGHMGHTLWRTTWGQNFLSQLSDETGGESYMVGFGPPVSFQPFLDEIRKRQERQYQLTFIARAENKSGMQPIRVSVPEKDASIAAPNMVFVKASM